MSIDAFLNKTTCGDCLNLLKELPENSVDLVCTDPPYELTSGGSGGFMGKKWDATGISFNPKVWGRVLRVLKPSGYLLCFGGTRTFHRIWCAIEDAGFNVKDTFMWIYGSGFPKAQSLDMLIDKRLGVDDKRDILESIPDRWSGKGNVLCRANEEEKEKVDITALASEQAKQWVGWKIGGLKPAWEPICIAQKPNSGTIVGDVLKFGVGGINVDAGRVPFQNEADEQESFQKNRHGDFNSNDGIRVPTKGIYHGDNRPPVNYDSSKGRFPANLAFDDATAKILDEMSGINKSVVRPSNTNSLTGNNLTPGKMEGIDTERGFNDSGGASRFFHEFNLTEADIPFFYTAKASASERNKGCEGLLPCLEVRTHGEMKPDTDGNSNNTTGQKPAVRENIHPTVKPLALIKHLLNLFSRPNAIVLDPFMGSGTTGVACKMLDRNFIGFELMPEYCKIADARIGSVKVQKTHEFFASMRKHHLERLKKEGEAKK